MSTRTTVKTLEAQIELLTIRLNDAARYCKKQDERIAYIETYLRTMSKGAKRKAA
jgi:chaperonin cofactor prefoldin